MEPTSRGEAWQKGALDEADVSGDERGSRAISESGDDDDMIEGAHLWPAARTKKDGQTDYKHVRIHADLRVDGDCTRVPFFELDLRASDDFGNFKLLPDREVKEFYRPKTVKHEVLFWPAVRTVDGKEEYKHVRIHDREYTCRDCVLRRPAGDGEKTPTMEDCTCDDCIRRRGHRDHEGKPDKLFEHSAQVPFDKRDLSADDGGGGYRLLPDHVVLSLFFHDETTTKENDDGDHQWVCQLKGAPIKVKGEGRAAHISHVIGSDNGPLQIAPEAWGMMQNDYDATTGRSGKYYGRKEGGVEEKNVQDAVKIQREAAKDCGVVHTKNDPSTAAVIMTVGQQKDGYWTSGRMCGQLPAVVAVAELTMSPHQQGVFVFDNSTGHNAFDDDALLPQNINLAPGGEKCALAEFEDDDGNTVRPTFQVGDTLQTARKIFLPKTEEEKKNPKLKHGKALPPIAVGTEVTRESPLLGLSKGAEQLLKEMELWKLPGEKKGLVLCCAQCKRESKASRQAITAFNKGGAERERVLEEARRKQQDSTGGQGGGGGGWNEAALLCPESTLRAEGFQGTAQQGREVLQGGWALVRLCVFLPKYHPELNAIERY